MTHEAGWAHAPGALRGPSWLQAPRDANELVLEAVDREPVAEEAHRGVEQAAHEERARAGSFAEREGVGEVDDGDLLGHDRQGAAARRLAQVRVHQLLRAVLLQEELPIAGAGEPLGRERGVEPHAPGGEFRPDVGEGRRGLFPPALACLDAAFGAGDTTMVLSPDSEFFRYFERGPGGWNTSDSATETTSAARSPISAEEKTAAAAPAW